MTTLTDVFDMDNDLLAAFPARPSEIRIGCARVSTGGQTLDRQVDALTLARCRRIFKEKKSGKNDARPELKACHAFLEAGDTLVVPSLDRYGRSLQDLVNMVAELRTRGIGFTSLHEKLDTLTPGGRLIFHVFAALAEFIRELIVQGTNEGLAARARGRVGGRPSVVNEKPGVDDAARREFDASGQCVVDVALHRVEVRGPHFGMFRWSVHRWLLVVPHVSTPGVAPRPCPGRRPLLVVMRGRTAPRRSGVSARQVSVVSSPACPATSTHDCPRGGGGRDAR